VLAIRGPLILSGGGTTKALCVNGCCNQVSLDAFVGSMPDAIGLDGHSCAGDDSRLCCDLSAFGQTVVASGTLTKVSATVTMMYGTQWTLTNAELCVEGPAGAVVGPTPAP
jgi:hypothetical protein